MFAGPPPPPRPNDLKRAKAQHLLDLLHKREGTCKTSLYSDGQKSCTFFLDFFCGPPGGGGPNLEQGDFVKWRSPTA